MADILHLEGQLLQIKGATKVISATSTQAVIEMGQRCVVLTGEKIEVKKLNLDEGEVCLFGEFATIKFAQANVKKGLLKRIFK